MILRTYYYKRTVHVRRSTCGGLDSEFSHSEVQNAKVAVVLPDDYRSSAMLGEAYTRSKGFPDDPHFEYLGFKPEEDVKVDTILYAPVHRI